MSQIAKDISKVVTDQMTANFEDARARIAEVVRQRNATMQLYLRALEDLEIALNQRDEAYDQLGEYLDIHRHDEERKALRLRTEQLLYGGDSISPEQR